jgi:hypothetical protein
MRRVPAPFLFCDSCGGEIGTPSSTSVGWMCRLMQKFEIYPRENEYGRVINFHNFKCMAAGRVGTKIYFAKNIYQRKNEGASTV